MVRPVVSAMEGGSPLGEIACLWRYPVKSLAPEALHIADVTIEGLAGDRQRALFVTTPEHARAGKTYRGKENNALHTTARVERARRVASTDGVAIEPRGGGPFFDAAPVSIVFDTWLTDAERLAGIALDPQRFRPNLFVRAERSFALREHDLVGATLEAGTVQLRVRKPITRCVTITYDVVSGAATPRVLSELARSRETILGIYADVHRAGTLRVGDVLRAVMFTSG